MATGLTDVLQRLFESEFFDVWMCGISLGLLEKIVCGIQVHITHVDAACAPGCSFFHWCSAKFASSICALMESSLCIVVWIYAPQFCTSPSTPTTSRSRRTSARSWERSPPKRSRISCPSSGVCRLDLAFPATVPCAISFIPKYRQRISYAGVHVPQRGGGPASWHVFPPASSFPTRLRTCGNDFFWSGKAGLDRGNFGTKRGKKIERAKDAFP